MSDLLESLFADHKPIIIGKSTQLRIEDPEELGQVAASIASDEAICLRQKLCYLLLLGFDQQLARLVILAIGTAVAIFADMKAQEIEALVDMGDAGLFYG